MISKIKNFIINIARRIVFGACSDPDRYLKWLRKKNIQIGDGTIFFDPINTVIDTQNPKLITIGKNVRITSGCKIITHDFSSSVIGGKYGECIGALGTVDIGDNVFIGMNTVILRNTEIGNNVIIGAGSVVLGSIDSDSVYAGVPAKKIMSLDEFYERRKIKVEDEIKKVINKLDFNDKQELWMYLREYSCDFSDAPEELWERQMNDTGYYNKCKNFYENYEKKYKIDDFR